MAGLAKALARQYPDQSQNLASNAQYDFRLKEFATEPVVIDSQRSAIWFWEESAGKETARDRPN